MTDLRTDPAFATAVSGARHAVQELYGAGIPDARALEDRRLGRNNLQGHFHSIIPLAVLFARAHPQYLAVIRSATDLEHDMGPQSREARNQQLWDFVKQRLQQLLAARGSEVITERLSNALPQTARDVASAYLSDEYGGNQANGRGGDTVLKRTLKLLAHVYVE